MSDSRQSSQDRHRCPFCGWTERFPFPLTSEGRSELYQRHLWDAHRKTYWDALREAGDCCPSAEAAE